MLEYIMHGLVTLHVCHRVPKNQLFQDSNKWSENNVSCIHPTNCLPDFVSQVLESYLLCKKYGKIINMYRDSSRSKK